MEVSLVTMGDVTVDLISFIESLPAIGEEAYVRRMEMHLGGSSTNVAIAASRLGMKSGFISKIGDDLFGRFLIERLQKEDVDISQVKIGDETLSGLVISMVTKNGERTMCTSRGINIYLSPEEIDENYIGRAKVFHLSGYSLLNDPQRSAAMKALEIAKEKGLLISLDPGVLAPTRIADRVRSILKSVNLIFLDESEARRLAGESPKDAAKRILELGPEIVALKLGLNGCLVLTKKEHISARAFDVSSVDTTGAGDAFDAGFLVGLGEKWDLEKTARFANAVGALEVMKVGAASSMPTRREVEEFIKSRVGERL